MRHSLWAALLALAATPGAIQAKGELKIGEQAPDFALTLVSGEKVSLTDLRGEVVVLNFWATWCAPCLEELPILNAFYQVLQNKGLRVFAITTEDSVPLPRLKKLFATMAIPSVKRVKGPYSVIKAVPTNIVIGRDGRIRYAAAGSFNLAKLNEIIIPLINERPPVAKTALN